MSNIFNKRRVTDAAYDMLDILNETMSIPPSAKGKRLLGDDITAAIKKVIENASPLDPAKFREISWVHFNGSAERESIVHVTYGDGSSTLCSKLTSHSGIHDVKTWEKGNPDADADRCKCCERRSEYVFTGKAPQLSGNNVKP